MVLPSIIKLFVFLKVAAACIGNPDAEIEAFGRNFTSNYIESQIHLDKSRFHTNDTVCRFLGYGARTVLDHASMGMAYPVVPGPGHERFRISIKALLERTHLWKDGQTIQAFAHKWLEAHPSSSNETLERAYWPSDAEAHDRFTALAAFDNHLANDGTFVVPPTSLAALEQMDNLHRLAATFAGEMHPIGDRTIANLLFFRKAIEHNFAKLNGSTPLNHDGTFDWFKSASNCFATGNHTKEGKKTIDNEELTYLNGPTHDEPGVWHINRCDKPYHFTAVGPNGDLFEHSTAVPAKSVYFEPFWASDVAGVSVKIANEPFGTLRGETAITQFEYNLNASQPDRMWMDLSFVNCGPHTNDRVNPDERRTFEDCPFRAEGWLAKWRDADELDCPHTYCEAVEDQTVDCKGAYHEPKDDWATKTCVWGMEAERYLDMELITCPNQKDLKGLKRENDWKTSSE